MTKALYRHSLDHDFPVAVKGDGVYLVDAAGKRYLDGSGGAAVSCLGHSNERVREAIRAQVDTLAFSHTRFFSNEPMEALAEDLVRGAPEGLTKAWFTCGGSESVEAALKMARQYFIETGQPQRRHVIGRMQSYHGTTSGALSVGGNIGRRAVFEPLLLSATHHISACFPYRGKRPDESDAQYGMRVANELEEKIIELGPDTVAAFIAETVVGSTLGCVSAVPGYFRRVREICHRYDVLLILDEVMCGMGRTGTRYACEQEGIAPDLLTIAKGLGGGYEPIGAVLLGRHIYDSFANGSGFFQHGHTYMGHPLACAAGLAVQETIRRDNLLANVRAQGALLRRRLGERFGNHPHVGDVRGRGLFQAIELVEERSTKTPFDSAKKLHARVKKAAMARGLMVYPMGGTIDGTQGDHVLLAPPFIVTEDQIGEIVDRLGSALDDALT